MKNKKRKKGNVAAAKPSLKPMLSVCMIVKDEERNIDRCLSSVKPVADEIIIVDTGSTDRTVEIAGKYTDKIYFHPWNDNFGEARNNYIKYAKGDWIFQIDADEELVKEDIPVLLEAVRDPDINCIMVQIVSRTSKGEGEARNNAERLFRNNGQIRYEGRIHETLAGDKISMIFPVHLVHHGYALDDKRLSEEKDQRRISLLKMDIRDQPENPIPYHYLGCSYLSRGLYHETLEVSLKALELAERTNDTNPIFLWTRYNAAKAYYGIKDLNNAESMAFSALALDNRSLDSHYILTLVYFDQSKWNDVIKHGNDYLRLSDRIRKRPEDFGVLVFNSLNESSNILVLMGIAYHEKGSLNDSDRSFRAAVTEADSPFPVLRAVGIFYHNKHLNSQAREFLQKALEINTKDRTVRDLLDQIGPDNKSRETISCCMIVKNEEEFLEKCLTSVRDYVDELIIVDTGSTDKTVDIAKRFTDKVYFHAWENSFSKARNQALQYASGDWIFQIDGDEELMEGSGERIRHAIKDARDADIIYVNLLCSYANGTKTSLHNFERLFRNNGKIHYEGSVHNQVVGGTKGYYSSIDLWHYGYDVKEDKAHEKFNRTTSLLKKEIEKDPDNPIYHHYLSASYYSRGMNKEALDEAVKAVELSEAQNNCRELFAWSYFIASMSFYNLKQLEGAKEYAHKALKKYPEHSDSYYVLTVVSADEGKWGDVILYGGTFLEMLENVKASNKNKGILTNTMNEGPTINILIGHAFYAENSYEEMEKHYKKACETAEKIWQAWWNIGVYHMDKSGDLKLAERFLNLAAEKAPEEYNVWYMLAKFNKKRGLMKEELKCLEKVVEIEATDNFVIERLLSLYMAENMPDKAMNLVLNYSDKVKPNGPILCKLAVMQLEKGRMEQAIKCYMMALERDANLFEAWTSLGEIMLGINNRADSKTFFEKALSIKGNDIGTILNLCDIASREGDIPSIIKNCDLLLKALKLPNDRTLNNFNDLRAILAEISSILRNNNHYQNQLRAISERISQFS